MTATVVSVPRFSPPHLACGLRISWLSPLRRETIMLLPNGCDAGPPLPALVVGRLPAQLQLPVAIAAVTNGSSNNNVAWRCVIDSSSSSTFKRALLRFAWEVRAGEVVMTVDGRTGQQQSGHEGAGCELHGAALLCAALCPSAPTAQQSQDDHAIHAALRHPTGFSLSEVSCLSVQQVRGNVVASTFPLGVSVEV